jgi:hypothetical protein
MVARSLTRPLAVLGIAVALTACGGTATPPPQTSGGGAAPASPGGAGSAEPGSADGPNGFEGTLTSSGIYEAIWTVIQDMPADPFNSLNNKTLTSDKDTFGNIKVEIDGKVSFGSGASELSQNGSYDGGGASVTLDSSGQFVCAFTVDADLAGNRDKAILHMKGGMTVHWHLSGVGDMNCP